MSSSGKILKLVTGGLTTADAFNNINTIKEYLNTPDGEKKSLDGLDVGIAAVSLAASAASHTASLANASKTTSVGAALAGTAFQLNAAIACV